MLLVNKAKQMSMHWHSSQKYGEVSYFDGHLRPVATLVGALGGTPTEVALAYMHDSLEDTLIPREDILFHFGQKFMDSLDALTKREGESYEAYMNRLVGNRSAIIVKLADSICNLTASSADWTENPEDEVALRRINRYTRNVGRLSRYT